MTPWDALVAARLARKTFRDRAAFHEASKLPLAIQRRVLFNLVARARETGFGRDHHFAAMRSLHDFRKQIPIGDYSYAEPYIERVKQGDVEALFHRERVLMFALTSGTTSARKFIPVTKRFLDDYRRVWAMWGLQTFEQHQNLFSSSKLALVSDYDEFRTPAGIPCGSISGLTAKMQSRVVRRSYCLPPESGKLHDTAAKYYLAWRLAATRSVGMWVSPNPSTLLNLARFIDEHEERLIRDVRDGRLTDKFEFPELVRRAVRRQLRPNPERARELERVISKTGHLRPKDVWPGLSLIGCWLGGSMGTYLRLFPEYFGDAAVRDIGLIASECRMTVSKEDGTPGGILEISSTYFEFIPVEEAASDQPTVLEVHQLQEGRDYYILLTTSSGLYRYNISDVVRVIGFHEQTPILAFLNKGSSIANVTGEKLSEHQVAGAVDAVQAELGLRLGTYSLAPCWDDRLPFYALYFEQGRLPDAAAADLAERLDAELREANCEYAAKRDSARLGPVAVRVLPAGAWEAWDSQRLAAGGGSPEQYKHPCLISDLEFAGRMPAADAQPAAQAQ